MINQFIIAIDGLSSCGKSTVAKALARSLHGKYIDTGAMYRAVTYYFIANDISIVDPEIVRDSLEQINIDFELTEDDKTETILNGQHVENEIRSMIVNKKVSIISAISRVRRFLVQKQREIAQKGGVFVIDGRDIGSVVFPNAQLKFYMTAEEEIRAYRRHKELLAKGLKISIEEVQQNLNDRDEIDMNREDSPLVQTDDAIVIDTSYMDQDAVLLKMKTIAEERIEIINLHN